MEYKFDITKIKQSLKENKKLPSFLDDEVNLHFEEKLDSMTGINQTKTNEVSQDNIKFIVSLFCHWLKLSKDSPLYYVEVDRTIANPYSFKVEGDEDDGLVIFFKVPYNNDKIEECIGNVTKNQLDSFFEWFSQELMSNGSLQKVRAKYSQVTNMLKEMRDNEEQDDLSEEFYDALDLMKESISKNTEIPFTLNEGELKDVLSELNEDREIRVNWCGKQYSFNLPYNITEKFAEDGRLLEALDNKNGWLSQQKHEIKETLCALWIDYLGTTLSENNELFSWEAFSLSVKGWLRHDCSLDAKKIDKKINNTYEKLIYGGNIESFEFVKSNSDFVKILLYIEQMVGKEIDKKSIIDVENVQQQYFYSLDNDLTLTQIWGAIVHDKLIKSKVWKTTSPQFEALKLKFPNFKEVIEYYSGAMYIYEQTGTTPAPVLLLGSPGLGKTHFANEISKVIGSQMTVIPISSLSAGWIITGAASQWKDAQMGKVASSLLNGVTNSPVIVLDEIDKKSEGNYNPLGGLYPLLEHQTAKDFVDEYLEFPIDASSVLWVATANTVNTIDEPILDRFVVFEIKKLSELETIEVAKTIYSELTNGMLGGVLSDDVLNILKDKTPRQIKQILKKGLAYAASSRMKDFNLTKDHIDYKMKIRKIGF